MFRDRSEQFRVPPREFTPSDEFLRELDSMGIRRDRLNWMLTSGAVEEQRRFEAQLRSNSRVQSPELSYQLLQQLRIIHIKPIEDGITSLCIICREDYSQKGPDAGCFDCNHWMHATCLMKWVQVKDAAVCPQCRQYSAKITLIETANKSGDPDLDASKWQPEIPRFD